LNVRLLVNTDQHLTTLVQPVNSLVTPQHLRRSRYKLVINGGSLPIPRAIRLQAGTSQYARHSRVVNRVNECLLDYDLLQRAAIPTTQVQSIRHWVGAGDALDLDTFERGKRLAVSHYAPRQRPLRPHAPSNAARVPKCLCGLLLTIAQSQRCVHHELKPRAHALSWQHAVKKLVC